MNREKFSSRLGFILISAGCAIGLGNVYRFPIITASYGGAFFVIMYIAFLLLLGVPVMTAELAVGRRSQRSIASSFDALEKQGQKWHLMKYLGIAGNYILMMFYCTISGWMMIYFFKYLTGSIVDVPASQLGDVFGAVVSNPALMLGVTVAVVVICFFVCSLGLQNGVERITKVMMLLLLALMAGLVIYSLTLDNALEGLRFYLIPSLDRVKEAGGIWTSVSAAMGQAFFTLSIGIGSIAIFGSYIGRERRLLGETITIVTLDTSVALMSGLIIFPAAFTYNNGVTADAGSVGASFLMTTLAGIFNDMPAGRLIGALFFLFMIFASFSTVIAVFENIMSFWLELTSLKRGQIAAINIFLMSALCAPAALGFNLLSGIHIGDKVIMDIEDFVVSNLLLPFGSLIYVLFCTSRYGMGWENTLEEANCGQGPRVPRWIRPYVTYVVPVVIVALMIMSLV